MFFVYFPATFPIMIMRVRKREREKEKEGEIRKIAFLSIKIKLST